MKVDVKVILGLGVAGAIAYYFWKKGKEKGKQEVIFAPAPIDTTTTKNDETPVSTNEYFAKEDITFGFVPNSSQPNVLFRKGDKIEGVITTRSGAFGQEEKGIMAVPTTIIGGNATRFFVPFSKLETKTTTKYFISDSGQVTRANQQYKMGRPNFTGKIPQINCIAPPCNF